MKQMMKTITDSVNICQGINGWEWLRLSFRFWSAGQYPMAFKSFHLSIKKGKKE